MFNNVGGKLKAVAEAACWIGIGLSCIYGLYILFAEAEGLLFLVIVGGGSLISWLSSLTLYGFGELIERVVAIDERINPKSAPSDISGVPGDPSSAETEPVREKKSGSCQMCGKDGEISHCKISDDYGTRYRDLCDDCIAKHNAKPV